MKLTDDKKAKEENGILFENCKDIESASNEIKSVEPKEEEEAGVKVKMEMHGVSKKCTRNVVMVNEKKVEEEENNNNFNLDMKEQEKNIKSITEDLEKFGTDNGTIDYRKKVTKVVHVVATRPTHDEEKEIIAVNMEMKGSADSSVEEIMTRMHKLGLKSDIRAKDKDQSKRSNFDMKALLRELSDERIKSNEEHCTSLNLKTVEITAQPEKKCEENEDFEKTRVLSDACDCQTEEPRCSSYIPRGPLGGIAKDTERHDFMEMLKKPDEVAQPPRKFGRPSDVYNPHMSGGCVQVVQPDNPFRSLYELGHLDGPNISSQYSEQIPDSFLWQVNSKGPAYYNDELKNYTDGYQMMQHHGQFYDGSSDHRGPVYPPVEDFPGYFEHGANPAWCDPEMIQNYHFDADHGICGMPYHQQNYYNFHGQLGSQNIPLPSARSPHDHCLTSPGSSPPSVLSYPLSPTSTILTNGDPDLSDLSMLSPGQYSLASPESGFGTDMSEDASRVLDDALAFIEADMAESQKANGNASLLPLAVEYLGSDLTSDASGPFQHVGNVPHHTKAKRQIRQPRKDARRAASKFTPSASVPEMAPSILPPVNGCGVPCATYYSPPGLSASQVPTAIQIPCYVVEPVKSEQKQSTRHFVPIQPKKNVEPSAQPAAKLSQPTDVSSSAVPKFSPPSTTQSSPQEPAVTSSSDQDQLVRAYRAVAGLPKEQLLGQDDDGDTILHLAIVKEKTKLVKALLERYVREELIDKVINLPNKQHQTPLCLAVFLNQTEIVKMLIERKADVNVQLQRKLNGGLKCYRLIHYAASRGKKWVPTLIQLLSADNIDLQAFNSEGCTAMHCAIECHGKHSQQGEEKIDSKDTIYHLAMRGADLNVQHGLCGKTPLHYAIEKKDSDLVGWFLGLASYIQSSDPKQSSTGKQQDLLHSLLNVRPSGGVTALQLTLSVQMKPTERIPILKMLLRDGAEVSQKGCDGKLRQELAKFPEIAGLLKNGASMTKNGPR